MGLATPTCKNILATKTPIMTQKPQSLGKEDSPVPHNGEEMTTHTEHRKETVCLNLLTSRRSTNIPTWNVQTMYAGGRTAVIAKEMRRYRISLLCETRWLQSGQVKLASGETILYSGHPEDSAPHTEGVGFILSKGAQRALISWEPVNSRIITAKFHTTHKKNKPSSSAVLCPYK